MKNILKITLVTMIGLIMFSSCEDAWDPIFKAADGTGTSYTQFMTDGSDFTVNKLNAAGESANATYDVSIQVLGSPSSTARTVNFSVSDHGVVVDDDDDTVMVPATAAMYTLSANSFTVEPGTTYGTITVTLVNLELPLEETVYFDIELTGGDIENAGNTTEGIVTLFKKNFCPYTKADLIGDWDVVEEAARGLTFNGTYHVSDGGTNILLFTESFWFTGPGSIWGETITDIGDPVPVVLDDSDPINPVVYIEAPQYLMTTDGAYEYWISDKNTYNGNNDWDWDFQYCDKTLRMYFYVPYGGATGGLVDIINVTMDWSGVKKVAYVDRTPIPDFNYSKLIK